MLSMTRYSIKNERLAPWIKFIWHFETENANIHLKLLPTDCIDIVLNVSHNMTYEVDSRKIIAPPLHINGLRDKFSYIHQTGNIRVFGISFYSFGLFPFINKSLEGMQNKTIDLYTISHRLAQQLNFSTDSDKIQETVECIEKILISELNDHNDCISKASLINDFMKTDYPITIQSFCQERGINIKTFERTFLHYTGYTPKLLRRIKRFQTASNHLAFQNPINLSGIAYDNNYSDQAHFIKDFQSFSGATPRAFQQEKITVKENTRYKYS